jgi:hypothetical protein
LITASRCRPSTAWASDSWPRARGSTTIVPLARASATSSSATSAETASRAAMKAKLDTRSGVGAGEQVGRGDEQPVGAQQHPGGELGARLDVQQVGPEHGVGRRVESTLGAGSGPLELPAGHGRPRRPERAATRPRPGPGSADRPVHSRPRPSGARCGRPHRRRPAPGRRPPVRPAPSRPRRGARPAGRCPRIRRRTRPTAMNRMIFSFGHGQLARRSRRIATA